MKIAYFDCFSGASGDMILGALIAAGLDENALRHDLERLPLQGFELSVERIKKQGFVAVKFDVRAPDEKAHRHLHHITKIIDAADLPDRIKDRSKLIFTRLAEAEAKVHGSTLEKVHFHEVGAIDAIVDIVGAAIGLERLGIDRILCSPIPTGSGTVTCQHGVMPVPAPATAELLIGAPIAACDEVGELTTPTGAAILTTLSDGFGPLPPMRIDRIGYGAGTRDGKTRPNVLRVILGPAAENEPTRDEIIVLETNLDDCTGEQIGHAVTRLFEAGAVDVFTTPISMKKNRPGVLLSVLSPAGLEAACEAVMFGETTTFGIRRSVWTRSTLNRRSVTVETQFGPVRMKIGTRNGAVMRATPEYDDCAAAAKACGAKLDEVMRAATAAFHAAP